MALEFHFEDIPPQVWLDELHTFNIPGLWEPRLQDVQRTNLAQRAKAQLKEWRLALRDQIDTIKMRYADEKKSELRLMIEPYRTLDSLGNSLNKAIQDLESKMKAGRALPLGVTIGTHIFGSLESGRWHFGDADRAKLWDEFESLERRYSSIKAEYEQQAGDYKLVASRVKEHQRDIARQTREYKARTGCLQITVRLLIVFGAAGVSLALGIMAFLLKPIQGAVVSNEAFGGIMLIVGVVGVMIAIVLTRRRRRRVKVLREDILTMKSDLKQLQQEAKRLRRGLHPTQQAYKAVTIEYRKMKVAFE